MPLDSAPCWAVNQSLGNRFAPAQAITRGGLRVDEETGAVFRGDEGVVKGLYAAGRAAVGLCSGGFVSGVSLADTIFSGKRAGRDAALAGVVRGVREGENGAGERDKVPAYA
ncbi:hypothetical protein K432DRAFT_429273 [Lepidopterella palustris CBS 459.81]|uniref:FAD-dependent oxidoreductase 2 FAD-binding domain-containing protein n=1 Tax=Lepidopterella palustris CBS 459.81 TaxID=1314670 RepID=A0A8E2E1G4_9PEZI|nr:hypothetical protein K432DRAFT_429273 [Lepidopterella palustris CBS 459.81]